LSSRYFAHESVEAALRSAVAELDVLDVVGRRILLSRLVHDLGRGDVDKLRGSVDELLDQPGTSDTIDARTLAGDPLHRKTER